MKKRLVLSLLSAVLFQSYSYAADEKSGQSELCLYAGHYLQKQNGICPTPPQGSCASGQVECNRALFNPVCVAANSNAVGTSSQCRDLSNAQGFSFIQNFSAEQKAEFNKIDASARAYFVQERDRKGQKGIISRKKASQQNVEADEIYTRYLNLKSLVASSVGLGKPTTSTGQTIPTPTPLGTPTNLLPKNFSQEECVGPNEADFAKCDDQIKSSVTSELLGACQLLLIEAESRKSKTGSLRKYDWDRKSKRYKTESATSSQVKLGKGGLAYGNRYFAMAPRANQRIERNSGQTPIGIYGGLMPVSNRVTNFRCVTDPGSEFYNSITTQENNIGKSSHDTLQYPYALMLRYPASYNSPKIEKNGACLMIQADTDKSCASRGCMSMASKDLEGVRGWYDSTQRPAVAILPKDEIKNLSSCVPGISSSQQSATTKDADESKARQ